MIGAQMFTLRDHLKTPEAIAQTLHRVAEMGYPGIQVSAFGPIDTDDLAGLLKKENLACAATHVSMDFMKDVDACLAYHEKLGCQYTAVGGCGKRDETRAEAFVEWAKEFNEVAGKLNERGLRVGYHNHAFELMQFDGVTALELIAQNTDAHVWFEIDTYWIAAGGGDPAAWIRWAKGRLPAVHFKDMTVGTGQQQKMCEVGSGNLNWPAILDACREAGVEHYLVERDTGDLDPFESLRISLQNMRAMGLQ